MSKKYRVEGMTCGGCASSITKALEGLGGNIKVEVNLEEKTVSVDGLDDAGVIGKAVEDAGFDYGGPV